MISTRASPPRIRRRLSSSPIYRNGALEPALAVEPADVHVLVRRNLVQNALELRDALLARDVQRERVVVERGCLEGGERGGRRAGARLGSFHHEVHGALEVAREHGGGVGRGGGGGAADVAVDAE